MPWLGVKNEHGMTERITKDSPYWSAGWSCWAEMGNKIEWELWGQNNMDLNSEAKEFMLYSAVSRNSVEIKNSGFDQESE